LAELDEDLSGGIDFEEFIKLVTTKPPEKTSRAEIHKIFRAFDPNRIVIILS
jgi:Ca2+-binding EF-hand superfamily protein